MDVQGFVINLFERGISLTPRPPDLVVDCASRLTATDREFIRDHKSEILAFLQHVGTTTPAESIIATYARYGITLTLDEQGTLLIRSATDNPELAFWPVLRMALDTHLEAIVTLIQSGYRLTAEVDFPSA
jgi:hypothetical protein